MEDMIFYDRMQFAFTITFHYLFPQLTMGLSLMIVYFKWRFIRTQNSHFNDAAKFWMKILKIGDRSEHSHFNHRIPTALLTCSEIMVVSVSDLTRKPLR